MSEKLHILQHALGLDAFGQGTWYRNHFVSGPSCDNYATLQELVADGLMVEHPPRDLSGGDSCFVVTEAGKKAVLERSQAPPRLSRSKKRYRRFLSWTDATGLPFRDFLRSEVAR